MLQIALLYLPLSIYEIYLMLLKKQTTGKDCDFFSILYFVDKWNEIRSELAFHFESNQGSQAQRCLR